MNEFRQKLTENIEIGKQMLYLSRENCIDCGLTTSEIVNVVETSLHEHGLKSTIMPAKTGIHTHNHSFFHSMPASIPSEEAYGLKWIATFPGNCDNHNLSRTSGLIIYNDSVSGYPVAVMEANWITSKRTAAVSVISAQYLANNNPESFGMFGCGIQGRQHVTFFLEQFPSLKRIYLHDIQPSNAEQLAELMKDKYEAEIICCESPEELMKKSEMVASATIILDKPDPGIRDEWVQKGQTILICELDSFWEIETMRRADKFIVDDIGQHEYFAANGYYPYGIPPVYSETGEVVAGVKKGRERNDELIMVNNSGMAVEDIMMAKVIFEKAMEKGLGMKLPL